MKLMKKLLIVLALLPLLSQASEGGFPLDHAPDRSRQLPALQNGARLFVNYCSGLASEVAGYFDKVSSALS